MNLRCEERVAAMHLRHHIVAASRPDPFQPLRVDFAIAGNGR